jgi:transcriptional regulator GlxA family with amidase domain
MFRNRYRRVNVDQGQLFIVHGRLYCSAGVDAGMDLSLYLLEGENQTFSEITCQVGYEDISIFRKVFSYDARNYKKVPRASVRKVNA